MGLSTAEDMENLRARLFAHLPLEEAKGCFRGVIGAMFGLE